MAAKLNVKFTQINELIDEGEEFRPYINMETQHKSILKKSRRYRRNFVEEKSAESVSEDSEEIDDFQFFNQKRTASKSMLPKVNKLNQKISLKENERNSNKSQGSRHSESDEVEVDLRRNRSRSK